MAPGATVFVPLNVDRINDIERYNKLLDPLATAAGGVVRTTK